MNLRNSKPSGVSDYDFLVTIKIPATEKRYFLMTLICNYLGFPMLHPLDDSTKKKEKKS